MEVLKERADILAELVDLIYNNYPKIVNFFKDLKIILIVNCGLLTILIGIFVAFGLVYLIDRRFS